MLQHKPKKAACESKRQRRSKIKARTLRLLRKIKDQLLNQPEQWDQSRGSAL